MSFGIFANLDMHCKMPSDNQTVHSRSMIPDAVRARPMYCRPPSNMPIPKPRKVNTTKIDIQTVATTAQKDPLSWFVDFEFILLHTEFTISHKIQVQKRILKAKAAKKTETNYPGKWKDLAAKKGQEIGSWLGRLRLRGRSKCRCLILYLSVVQVVARFFKNFPLVFPISIIGSSAFG